MADESKGFLGVLRVGGYEKVFGAESVEEWMLKPLLDGIADLVGRVPAFSARSWEERFSFAYQIQGAIFYFMISKPTLENMYGRDRYEHIAEAFRSTLKAQIERFQSS